MDPTDRSEGPDSPAQTRPRRSRTGCLTCRTRRRKCDESKPTCQNCISKNLDCEYPATFQFLGKNNFTPEVATNVQYKNLRFVADAEHQAQDGSENEESQSALSRHTQISPLTTTKQKSEVDEFDLNGTEIVTSQRRVSESTSTDNYEFALHGLLALGSAHEHPASEHVEVAVPTDPYMTESPSTAREEAVGILTKTPQDTSNAEGRLSGGGNLEAWQLVDMPGSGEGLLPQARVLELLKHYRYDIAPWLDIGDANQSFGCEVLQLSTESIAIHYSVLAIAERSLEVRQPYDRANGGFDLVVLADSLQQRECESSSIHCAFMKVMSLVRGTITAFQKQWLPEEKDPDQNGVDVMLLPHVSSSSLALSIYWLWIRLQLSIALATTGPILGSLNIAPASSPFRRHHADAPELLRESRNAVAMCLEIFIFCNDDVGKQIECRYGQNRVEAWTNLVHLLENSYTSRPTSLKPIVELYPRDGRHSDDEFPTIVFTSGGAILANQLYHTGMLLLLQNKPRFATQRSSSSPFMSILWHARRICGIAMNNDRRECWDPCLLASFFMAARTTTHQSQHAAIIDAIGHIERLTFWRIPDHMNALRDEWRLAEGW